MRFEKGKVVETLSMFSFGIFYVRNAADEHVGFGASHALTYNWHASCVTGLQQPDHLAKRFVPVLHCNTDGR